MNRSRVLAITLAVVALLLGGVVVMYAFGTPQAPSSPAGQPASLPAEEPSGAASSQAASGTVPQPDPSSPLAIEIPGCVCHSDDPAVVEEHAGYRMNQCFGCHAEGMPEMGQ